MSLGPSLLRGVQLLHLVEQIYRAVEEPAAWTEVLSLLGSALNCLAGTITLQETRVARGVIDCHFGMDPGFANRYEEYSSKNVLIEAAAPVLRPGRVMLCEEVMPYATLVKTDYFNDYLRQVGVLPNLAACLAKSDQLIGLLTMARQIGKAVFDADDLRFVRALVPHLQRALSLQQKLNGLNLRGNSAEAALNRLPMGVLVLGSCGEVLFLNDSAEKLLKADDGLRLDREGRLYATNSKEQRQLLVMVNTACSDLAGR